MQVHKHVIIAWYGYYVIVIVRVPGIYGSKRTESEGKARRQGLFTLP